MNFTDLIVGLLIILSLGGLLVSYNLLRQYFGFGVTLGVSLVALFYMTTPGVIVFVAIMGIILPLIKVLQTIKNKPVLGQVHDYTKDELTAIIELISLVSLGRMEAVKDLETLIRASLKKQNIDLNEIEYEELISRIKFIIKDNALLHVMDNNV